jgi:hypothetical protein
LGDPPEIADGKTYTALLPIDIYLCESILSSWSRRIGILQLDFQILAFQYPSA